MPAISQVPDAAGRFGAFGGRYVPETLTRALDQLTAEYAKARADAEVLARVLKSIAPVLGAHLPAVAERPPGEERDRACSRPARNSAVRRRYDERGGIDSRDTSPSGVC